jgi:sigma-B regulation protein RsbU (phosphoserine phosphatase)
MLPGDRLVAIDGMRITDQEFQNRIWMLHRPGDQIHLEIQRPGVQAPIYLTGTFRRKESLPAKGFFVRLNVWFPVPFLVVGLTVLFLRLEDPFAWLLAAMFAGVIASRGMPSVTPVPKWWNVTMMYQGILVGMVGPLFYWLYARFPRRSPLDRRWPGLKWLFVTLGVVMAAGSASTGSLSLPAPIATTLGKQAADQIALLIVVICMMMGLVSFATNYFSAPDVQSRRRMRVIFWGTVLGLGPNLLKVGIQSFTAIHVPLWIEGVLTLLLFLTPVFFAYAVVVHRVLELPVLLRRSARYLLVQRGFTILLSLGSIGLTMLFALSLPRYVQAAEDVSQPSSIALGAVFGTALLWAGTQVHRRVSNRIDRAFFRGAYDARMILEDLAEKTRAAVSRSELAHLLETHLNEALKPRFLIVQLGPPEADRAADPPECVVPLPGRDGKPIGALLLGPRLSEEPYSREDRRLLESIASQAATALENMHLAEEIAERIERERRASREMEIARDVQSRLLPQSPPRLNTLECAACCIQARSVGGDYYDFLDLGAERVGLVLGDVSGKGVHAALLVANLEAYLRSQSSIVPLDPVRVLQHVNLMLCRSTAPEHFATLFFGVYDDASRELVYVNCGHNPPIWIRADGTVARLQPTATVIGAFEQWSASACHARLDPGDLLVVFSDGVTEAPRGEEDFGERRLIELLTAANGNAAQDVVSAIVADVQEFSEGAQADDLTLLVARARE